MTDTIIDLSEETLPDLTVVPIDSMPGWYHVRGRFSWYRCTPGDDSHLPRCSCPFHKHKLLGSNRPCRHLRAVLEYIEAMTKPRTCPCCGQEWPR
jgi:hypothetical protein